MSNRLLTPPDSPQRPTARHTPLLASAIPLALISLSMLSAPPLHAEEDQVVAEIQAEIAKLQQKLEQRQQELQAQQQAAPTRRKTARKTTQPTESSAKTASSGEASTLDAVVISGKKQNVLEKVKDRPTSISVVSGQELTKFSATNITDVLARIGNVRFNYGNPKTGSLSMRGISTGLTSGGSDQIDPSVGVVYDDISYAYNALVTGADFVDVETIDVTRGPQGSDCCKNSSLGRITVLTKQPTFNTEWNASLLLGENNAVKTMAAVGGSIIDGLLAWRGTFYRNQQDGEYHNAFPIIKGRTSYVNTDRTYGKLQFLLTPSENFNARLMVEDQPNGGEYLNGLTFKLPTPTTYANGQLVDQSLQPAGLLSRNWFTREKSYSVADYFLNPVYLDNNGSIITGSRGTSATLNWLFSGHTLTSITAFKDHYFSAANDGDGTPFDVSQNTGYISYYEQYSQEFRLKSDPGGFIDYQTGLYFLRTTNDSLQRTRYGSDGGAWYASNAQYNTLNANTAGQRLLTDSVDRMWKTTDTDVENKSGAAFGEVNWHLTEPVTLTTGLRVNRENRHTTVAQLVNDDGFGAALNPVAVNNLALGGFASAANGTLSAGNSTSQLSLADQVANRYFGTTISGKPGAAYNSLTAAQKNQVAAAKAVRLTQLGPLFTATAAEPYQDWLPTGNIALTYAVNDRVKTYGSYRRGAKAGISQIVGGTILGGTSVLVEPEISNVFELGVKGNWLHNTLTINADVFQDTITDFQQTVYFFDPVATALVNNGSAQYVAGNGNVPKVRVRGFELDGIYAATENLTFRFAGAYNDAKYVENKFSGQPVERANEAQKYRDVSGWTLPQAPKVTFDISASYFRPVFADKLFHASIDYRYTSRYNVDTALSSYAWVEPYGLTDVSIGIDRQDGLIQINVIGKNVFDVQYHGTQTWNSWAPNSPRWFGIAFTSRF